MSPPAPNRYAASLEAQPLLLLLCHGHAPPSIFWTRSAAWRFHRASSHRQWDERHKEKSRSRYAPTRLQAWPQGLDRETLEYRSSPSALMRARTVRLVTTARALRALDAELRRMVLCTERYAAQRHTQRHQRRRNNQRDALAHQVPPSSRLPPGWLTEVRKAQNECRLPSMSSFPFARGPSRGSRGPYTQRVRLPFPRTFLRCYLRLLLLPFSKRKNRLTPPPPAASEGGSRLRYWLCPSLLSAHLYESELLSLYLGFYARFPSGPHIKAVLGGCASAGWHMRKAHSWRPLRVRRSSRLTNFGERGHGELLRIPLLGTSVNKGKSKGWATGKPTSNSGKEKELLRR
jgi:hypothetical protein